MYKFFNLAIACSFLFLVIKSSFIDNIDKSESKNIDNSITKCIAKCSAEKASIVQVKPEEKEVSSARNDVLVKGEVDNLSELDSQNLKSYQTTAGNTKSDKKSLNEKNKDELFYQGFGFFERTFYKMFSSIFSSKEMFWFLTSLSLDSYDKTHVSASNSSSKGTTILVGNDKLINNIFKGYTKKSGTGKIAVCGHKLRISYNLMNSNFVSLEKKSLELDTVNSVSPSLISNLAIGMRQNEIKNFVLDTAFLNRLELSKSLNANMFLEYAKNNAKKYNENKVFTSNSIDSGKLTSESSQKYNLELYLDEILVGGKSNAYAYVKVEELKVFDDLISFHMPFVCGDRVRGLVKITDLGSNRVLYEDNVSISYEMNKQDIEQRAMEYAYDINNANNQNNEKVNETTKDLGFLIGDQELPVVFAYALHGKYQFGKRTIITYGKYLYNFYGLLPKMLKSQNIAKDKYYMIEFDNFEFGL